MFGNFTDWPAFTNESLGKFFLRRMRIARLAEPRSSFSCIVCLRETSLKKTKKDCSLSPPSGAPRRIGAVDAERSEPQFD